MLFKSDLVVQISENFKVTGYSGDDFETKFEKKAEADCKMRGEMTEVRDNKFEKLYKVKQAIGDGLGYNIRTYFEKRVSNERVIDQGDVRLPSILQFKQQCARRMFAMYLEFTKGKLETEILNLQLARPTVDNAEQEENGQTSSAPMDECGLPVEEFVGCSDNAVVKYQKVQTGMRVPTLISEESPHEGGTTFKKYKAVTQRFREFVVLLKSYKDKGVCSVPQLNGILRELETCKRNFAGVGDVDNAAEAGIMHDEAKTLSSFIQVLRNYGYPERIVAKQEIQFYNGMQQALACKQYVASHIPIALVMHYQGMYGAKMYGDSNHLEAAQGISKVKLLALCGDSADAHETHVKYGAKLIDAIYVTARKHEENPTLSKPQRVKEKAKLICDDLSLFMATKMFEGEELSALDVLYSYLRGVMPTRFSLLDTPQVIEDLAKFVETECDHPFIVAHRNSELFKSLMTHAASAIGEGQAESARTMDKKIVKTAIHDFEDTREKFRDLLVSGHNTLTRVDDQILPAISRLITAGAQDANDLNDPVEDNLDTVADANLCLSLVRSACRRILAHTSEGVFQNILELTPAKCEQTKAHDNLEDLIDRMEGVAKQFETLRAIQGQPTFDVPLGMQEGDTYVDRAKAALLTFIQLRKVFLQVCPEDKKSSICFKDAGPLIDAITGTIGTDSELRAALATLTEMWDSLKANTLLKGSVWNSKRVDAIIKSVSDFLDPLLKRRSEMIDLFKATTVQERAEYKKVAGTEPTFFLPVLPQKEHKVYKVIAEHNRDPKFARTAMSICSLADASGEDVEEVRVTASMSDLKVLGSATFLTCFDARAKHPKESPDRLAKVFSVAATAIVRFLDKGAEVLATDISTSNAVGNQKYEAACIFAFQEIIWPTMVHAIKVFIGFAKDAMGLVHPTYKEVIGTQNYAMVQESLMQKAKCETLQTAALAANSIKGSIKEISDAMEKGFRNAYTIPNEEERVALFKSFDTEADELLKYNDVQQGLNLVIFKFRSKKTPLTTAQKKHELKDFARPQSARPIDPGQKGLSL